MFPNYSELYGLSCNLAETCYAVLWPVPSPGESKCVMVNNTELCKVYLLYWRVLLKLKEDLSVYFNGDIQDVVVSMDGIILMLHSGGRLPSSVD